MLRLAVERQHARSIRPLPGSPTGPGADAWRDALLERVSDADFMIIALWRLQLLAQWAASAPWATRELRQEIRRFKKVVPHLREIRDTQEHFDEYSGGIGRRQRRKGEQPSGWGYGHGPGGMTMTYGRFVIYLGFAHDAAQQLHRAIRSTVDELASQDVHGGPETAIIRNL